LEVKKHKYKTPTFRVTKREEEEKEEIGNKEEVSE
jgi:hypothetical protein